MTRKGNSVIIFVNNIKEVKNGQSDKRMVERTGINADQLIELLVKNASAKLTLFITTTQF